MSIKYIRKTQTVKCCVPLCKGADMLASLITMGAEIVEVRV